MSRLKTKLKPNVQKVKGARNYALFDAKPILLILLISILLWPACKNTQSQKIEYQTLVPNAKRLELVLTLEKEAKIDIISKFIPHLVPAAGIADSIYVYARSDGGKDSSVTRYDTNLEIKKKYIIRYGKGPGEAINPQFLPDISGSILVYAPVNGRYIRFSPDLEIIGEHRRRYFEGSFVAGGAYMPACNSVLDGYSLHHDFFKGRDVVSIFRLKANGRVSEKIIYKAPRLFYSKAKEFLVGKWFHFGYFFGNIYVLDKSGYKILKMDDNGNILKAVRMPFVPKPLSGEQQKYWGAKLDFFKKNGVSDQLMPPEIWPANWMMRFGDGFVVARNVTYNISDTSPIPVDYFDADLNHLGRFELPHFSSWNHPSWGQGLVRMTLFYKDGKLYKLISKPSKESDEDDYYIVKYHVGIKNKT